MLMFKKISKILVTTAMCTLLMASQNNKTILSNPWTLKVTSLTCSGQYGIRFAPAMVNSNDNVDGMQIN